MMILILAGDEGMSRTGLTSSKRAQPRVMNPIQRGISSGDFSVGIQNLIISQGLKPGGWIMGSHHYINDDQN
jgi:hypothetical protein